MTHVFLDIETIAETPDFANYSKKSVREARYCGESSEAPDDERGLLSDFFEMINKA